MPWRGPAGVSPQPGGVYLRFREREGEALGVPAQGSQPRSAQTTAPLHGAKLPDALRARSVRQRASGNERGKSACGSAKKAAPSGAHSAGQSASSGNSRSTVNCTTGIWWSQHTEQATKVYGKDQRPTQW